MFYLYAIFAVVMVVLNAIGTISVSWLLLAGMLAFPLFLVFLIGVVGFGLAIWATS